MRRSHLEASLRYGGLLYSSIPHVRCVPVKQMARNSSDFNESPVARHASTPLTGVSANGSAGVASKLSRILISHTFALADGKPVC